jgi:hypothetical protein
MIERQAIEAKLTELKRSREQILATLNAHNGAIEICEQLLKDADLADRPQGDAESPQQHKQKKQ